MSIIIVKDEKSAASVKPGDSYFIDVWPPADQEDQEITEEMLALADKLEQLVRDNIAAPQVPSKSQLNKMKEADVVKLAVDMGIEASTDDKKSDTIKKILKEK